MDNSSSFCIIGLIVFFVFLILAIVAKEKQKENRANHSITLHDHLQKTGFTISNSFTWANLEVVIDTEHKMFEILNSAFCTYKNIKFGELIECETIENDSIVASGGVGRAIVGGVLAGGVGAIVGASTRGSTSVVSHLAVKLTTNDINNPLFMVELINSQIECATEKYQQARKFADKLQATCTSIIKQENLVQQKVIERKEEVPRDNISKIKELGELLEKGILTNGEFQDQKNKLLSNMDHNSKFIEAEKQAGKVTVIKPEELSHKLAALQKQKYWENHPEEYKSRLDEEKRIKLEFGEKIIKARKILSEKLIYAEEINKNITELRKGHEKLGILAGSQKKAIDEKIKLLEKEYARNKDEFNEIKTQLQALKP